MNELQKIRDARNLTYEDLGKLAGYARHVAWKHCQSRRISAEAAVRYATALDVSPKLFRPDLWSA